MAGDRDGHRRLPRRPAARSVTPASSRWPAPSRGRCRSTADVTDNGQIERVEFKVGNALLEGRRGALRLRLPVPTAMFPDGPVTHHRDRVRQGRQLRTRRRSTSSSTTPRRSSASPARTVRPSRPARPRPGRSTRPRRRRRTFETACSVVPQGATRVFVPCSGDGSHSVSGLPEGRYEFAFGARTPPATTPRPCGSSGSRPRCGRGRVHRRRRRAFDGARRRAPAAGARRRVGAARAAPRRRAPEDRRRARLPLRLAEPRDQALELRRPRRARGRDRDRQLREGLRQEVAQALRASAPAASP